MKKPDTRWIALLAALLLLALPLAALAKDGRRGAGRHSPEERIARLSERLHLSAEQEEQLRPILEEQAETMRSIRERKHAGEASREELREEMRAQREAAREQIEAVLDDDQRAAFQTLREERREHRRKFEKHRRGEGAYGEANAEGPA